MKIGAFTGFRVFLLGLVLVVVALAVCIFRSSRPSAKEIRHILLISIVALSANKHELAASIKTRIQRYKRGQDIYN